jgi:hypothetical protein
MHAVRTEVQDARPDKAYRMIRIGKPWTIRRWSELKQANGKPIVRITNENSHLVDLECTEEEQAKLKTLVERDTSQGSSGAWRVHRWRLASLSLVLGDTEDRNNISRQWYNEWPLDTWVDSPIFRWLRDTFLPILVNAAAEYPKRDEDDTSNEAFLHEPQSKSRAMPLRTYSSKGCAIFPSARPSSSFELVAHKVFCGLFGYILHMCGNGQRREHRNAS